MPEHGPQPSASELLAQSTSRRGFLARVSKTLLVLTGGSLAAAAIESQRAEAYHFCGHTFTTGSCPHPTGLPRIDAHGLPLRAKDGVAIDNLGRPIDGQGRPVDEHGRLLSDLEGQPLPPAPRTKVCSEVEARFGIRARHDGSWYRCCDGHVRKLMDCCSYSNTRINGDAALTGYCYAGRKVFCVMYHQTNVPC